MASSIPYDLQAPAGNEAASESPDEAQRRPALQDFLAANYTRLHRRLLRYLGCPDLASDCLHDAWLRLREMASPASVQSPEAYVYRTACNLAMDRMRGNRHRQYTGDADTELDHVVDDAPGPDRIAQARSELAAVERSIGCLPRRHRSVMLALRIDELTRQEVAARYDISLRSVDTTLRQALDYCAANTGQQMPASVRGPWRALRLQRLQMAEA